MTFTCLPALSPPQDPPSCTFSLSHTQGVAHAYSKCRVSISYNPVASEESTSHVICDINGQEVRCKIIARAAFPELRIVSGRCVVRSSTHRAHDPSQNATPDQPSLTGLDIWAQFDIPRLNQLLRGPGVDPNRAVAFRFLPAPLGSSPQIVSLRLKNTGELDMDFHFKFPNDRDIEVG